MGHIRKSKIHSQNDDTPEDVDPWRRIGARDQELKERKEGVQAVLGDVCELGVGVCPPAAEQYSPVYDGYQEWVGGDGGVEEAVEGLEWTWEG